MREDEPVRLDAMDWEAIFPGKNFSVGEKVLYIRPFEFEDIGRIAAMLSRLGVAESPEALLSKQYLAEMAVILVQEFPEMLEKASGLHRDDIRRLPLSVAMKMLSVIIDVNMASYEGLEKNLPGAIRQVARILPLVWLMCSKFSLETDTTGAKSEDTPSEK